MTNEEAILKKYEEKLTYKYAKANTKSKMKRLTYDLCTLSELYSMYPNINRRLAWERDRTLIPFIEDYNIPFSKYVIDNKELYSKVFLNVIEEFKTAKFPFYKDYRKYFKKLPENITDELICSFLNEYDSNLLKIYKQLIKEGKLFKGSQERDFAIIFTLSALNENLIFPINTEGNNLYTSSVIIHEMGHLYENNIYNNTGNINLISLANRYPYYEVSSRFFEYCYLNYLRDNNIFSEEVDIAIKNHYVDLFINSFNITLLYKLKQIEIDDHDCVAIEETEVLEYANNLMNELNLHSLETLKGDMLDFRESFIYGIGDIFSIYLYEIYKEDPRNFKKEFENILLTYPYTGDISVFERIGITKEKLIKIEEIKKKIRKVK